MKSRKIDRRFKPPVKGLDLWQAMNFIDLEDVSLEFVNDSHTSSTPCHVKGSRPVLEKLAQRFCSRKGSALSRVVSLAGYVAATVRWAGWLEKERGRRLDGDRNFSEEQVLRSGFGWCNEQARVFCTLAQLCGFPARLVFASNKKERCGHVVSEVLVRGKWMLVDQSFGYCFFNKGRPVGSWEVYHRPAMARYFRPIYRSICARLEKDLGREILSRDFRMALMENPLGGFDSLGYCNHFV
ncbi:MAG: transglutaminase domain-containing protein [Terrimicrobiaceae bacterium]